MNLYQISVLLFLYCFYKCGAEQFWCECNTALSCSNDECDKELKMTFNGTGDYRIQNKTDRFYHYNLTCNANFALTMNGTTIATCDLCSYKFLNELPTCQPLFEGDSMSQIKKNSRPGNLTELSPNSASTDDFMTFTLSFFVAFLLVFAFGLIIYIYRASITRTSQAQPIPMTELNRNHGTLNQQNNVTTYCTTSIQSTSPLHVVQGYSIPSQIPKNYEYSYPVVTCSSSQGANTDNEE